jgi:hypothetical protein
MTLITNHPLRCQCGQLQGQVRVDARLNHGVCSCRDCQAFAHFLGQADAVLDGQGGTEIVATLPQNVRFTQGASQLACMRLSPNGLLRWYARCCNTPIGNTPPGYKLHFVGLVHTCLKGGASANGTDAINASFGPVRMHVHTKFAKNTPAGKPASMVASSVTSVLGFMRHVLRARLDGSYTTTPFFSAAGEVAVVPTVVSAAERQQLMGLVLP